MPLMSRWLAALCLAGLLPPPVAASVQAPSRDFDRTALIRTGASVLKIEAVSADGRFQLGSGVIVGDRKVVTNCHVTRQAAKIHVVKGGVRWRASMQAADMAHDICLLAVPQLEGDAVPIASSSSLKVGQSVMAIGYTGGVGLQLSGGQVIALHRLAGSHIVQSSNWFSSGASGGGLFDASGALVGVLTFRLRGGAAHYFAAPADWLRDQIDDVNRYGAVEPLAGRSFWEETPESQPLFLQAAALEQGRQWGALARLAMYWTLDDASDPEAPYALAVAYDGQGQTDAAITALRRCLDIDPTYARAWARLAVLYKRQGQLGDARHALAGLEPLDPALAGELSKELDQP